MRLRFLLTAALALAGCATTPPATRPDVAFAEPSPGVYAAGRLAPTDVDALARAGVRGVIDLSLDTETPDFDEAAAVRGAGLRYDALPVKGADGLTRERVVAFDRLLRDARRPVLVHCASGNRVGAMAALRAGWLQGRDLEAALAEGRRWGLKGLEPEVRRRLEAGSAAP
ncbi:protein tyrosine phosphatase family protein [Lysobacter xanthus]